MLDNSASVETRQMVIPLPVAKFENEVKSRLPVHSVAKLAQFPFSSYSDFLQAVEQGKVSFWIRRDYRLLWKICSFQDRLIYGFCAHIGFIVAVVLIATSLITRDYWLLLSVPVFVLSNLSAVPSPGCIHGFLPAIAALICCCLGLAFSPSLTMVSMLWMFPWMIASFGAAVVMEVTIDSVKHSEIILIWALCNEVVSVQSID